MNPNHHYEYNPIQRPNVLKQEHHRRLSPSSVVDPCLKQEAETLCAKNHMLVVKESGTIRTLGLARFNFGPACSDDFLDDDNVRTTATTLYTSCSPGYSSDCKNKHISEEDSLEWIRFMKSQGISHVISLLDDWELERNYPQRESLAHWLERDGLHSHHESMKEAGSFQRIMDIIANVQQRREKVVVHCTGGCGRSGRVAAAWVLYQQQQYRMQQQQATARPILLQELMQATNAVIQVAIAHSICRKGDVGMLKKWIGKEVHVESMIDGVDAKSAVPSAVLDCCKCGGKPSSSSSSSSLPPVPRDKNTDEEQAPLEE